MNDREIFIYIVLILIEWEPLSVAFFSLSLTNSMELRPSWETASYADLIILK
jgi:hypothetical protein